MRWTGASREHFVIASDSEAIQFCGAVLDCFVANAPRNDEKLNSDAENAAREQV